MDTYDMTKLTDDVGKDVETLINEEFCISYFFNKILVSYNPDMCIFIFFVCLLKTMFLKAKLFYKYIRSVHTSVRL